MEEDSFSWTAPPPVDVVVVQDVAAARFLSRPNDQRYFTPFLGRERTAASVARDLGVDTGSVTYRIRRMLALGLIVQTRLEPRAGRAVRHFRSVADAVFVPLVLTSLTSLEDLFDTGRADTAGALGRALERAWTTLGRESGWGTHLYRRPDGVLNRDFVPRELLRGDAFWRRVLAPASPAVWDQFAELHLTRLQAKELQRELADVVHRYATATTQGPREPHLVHLALAPRR